MVPHKVIDSFNAAVAGIVHVLKTQRNMRFHFLAAVGVVLISVILGMAFEDLLFLLSAIVLVLLAEMINTAIEMTVDLVQDSYHPLARIAKDVSAGAVFLVSLYAVGVGYLVFFTRGYLVRPLSISLGAIRSSKWDAAFVTLVAVSILTLIAKVVFHRGTPFRGGLPSLHAALAFSIFTLAALIPQTPLVVVVLVFALAFLVAQSRIASRIHTIPEVASGALWGAALTFFLYKLILGPAS
ncbi:MAG: diacylglycerol kinase [Candidatus Erginobacter occultus]|nr:diacylglycerol kinase [Candidatus Erginobacter occultus]